MGAIVLKRETRASITLVECLKYRAVPQYFVENELLCDLHGVEHEESRACWRKRQGVMSRSVSDFTDIMDFMLISWEERDRRVVDIFMEFSAGCRAGVEAVAPRRRYYEPMRCVT